MSAVIIDDQTLRGLLKEALIELMHERPELLRAMLADAMEEVGLTEAIRQGAQTATVAKSTVLKALE